MKSVTDGNGTTHFIEMPDNGKSAGVMLFIPLAVSLVEQVPMLVYYHGHNSQHSIESYVKAMPQRDFRPSLRDKQVLLVEPWGGGGSRFGTLQTPAGLEALIDFAMFTAISNGPPVRPCPVRSPPPKSLILSGFSGGGQALNGVAMSASGSYFRLLSEVWCFDCMYSEEGSKWATWAAGHKSVKLRVRLSSGESSGSPRKQGGILAAGSKGLNVDVGAVVSSGHEDLPGKFISTFL
jgi:hypothetical protein